MRRGEDATHFLVHRLNVEPLDPSHRCERRVEWWRRVEWRDRRHPSPCVRLQSWTAGLRCPLGVPLLYSQLRIILGDNTTCINTKYNIIRIIHNTQGQASSQNNTRVGASNRPTAPRRQFTRHVDLRDAHFGCGSSLPPSWTHLRPSRPSCVRGRPWSSLVFAGRSGFGLNAHKFTG